MAPEYRPCRQDCGVLQKSVLFSGLTEEELPQALDFFGAVWASAPRGSFLARAGESLPAFGLVLDGSVQVCMLFEKLVLLLLKFGYGRLTAR